MEGGNYDHRTLHEIVAAVTQQKKPDLKIRLHRNDLLPAPKTWKELLNHPNHVQFTKAARLEWDIFKQKEIWEVIPKSEGRTRPVPLMWVFIYKFDKDGYLERYKARLVARGDQQTPNTLESTYAATLAARNFRLAFALMAYFDLEAEQINISNAFLNATLDMEFPVYCTAPKGFGSKKTALRLRKTLYGIRKSPKLWYEKLLKTLQDFGLSPVGDEPCMCVSEQSKVIVIFFVDGIVVLYFKNHTKEGKAVISGPKTKYELREGPLSWFLGMRVLRNKERRTATILHDFYIEKIGMRFRFTESKGYPTIPLPEGFIPKFEGKAFPKEIKLYQEIIGSILYTAIMLRPDVAHAASLLSRFFTNPSPLHRRLTKRVLQYLYGTRFLGIRYGVI